MTLTDEPTVEIRTTLNGESISARVVLRQSVVDWVRHEAGLTGSHVGCEHGVCGACHVILDGKIVRGCLMLAVQLDGADIVTIDASVPSKEVRALQGAFHDRAALQCGFCTPGMILQACELLRENGAPSRSEIREAISGNYCRCTGYHAIVDAIENAAATLRGEQPA
ncbi:aerobic-type carbon monoxide dehydrogenase small subunit (CoxS/CutS family) [Nitrobacteraceae bacterium AZCC 2161]